MSENSRRFDVPDPVGQTQAQLQPSRFPAGTVTMLFTDIEGSTRLLRRLGDRYGEALLEHRQCLRDVFGRHGGIEVDTQGDAFFFAFASARAAVAGAAEAQSALIGNQVRVRMGVHTGEPMLNNGGYVGVDVHRAARICSAAHGGQVLVSDTTARLVQANLRSLGDHQLKDFDDPIRLYQLGDEEFPPLRVPGFTNLPVAVTDFVGRERELEEVDRLLRDHRVVTLLGAGGIGKTRLALEVAARAVGHFEDGVYWTPLSSVVDPDLLEPAITRALGTTARVADYLANRELLLVLDNFEQIVDGAALLAELLAAAPALKLLVTSREALRITAEWVYEVPPLTETGSMVLFMERARSVRGHFEADESVAEICRRLDGLPLALELAAARVKVMSPNQILGRLGSRLEILTSGARDLPARQRTIRAAFDWSYDLLGQGEQDLFARLGAFAGGWTMDAAEAVCQGSLDLLESLATKSLIKQRLGRFEMLESMREYAVDRLDSSAEAKPVRDQHARFFLAFAEEAAAGLEGPDCEEWTGRLDAEHDNLQVALDHFNQSSEPDLELRLVAAIWRFWFERGLWAETSRAVLRALAPPSGALSPALAIVTQGAAWTAWRLGDMVAGAERAEWALRLSRELDDARLIGLSLSILATCLSDEKPERARRLYRESWDVCESVGDRRGMSRAANNLAKLATDDAEAAEGYARGLSLVRELGDDRACSIYLMNLGDTERCLGRSSEAAMHLAEGLSIARRLGFREVIVECLYGAAYLAADTGHHQMAGALLGAAQREGAFGHVFESRRDRAQFEHALDKIRLALDHEGLDEAIRTGRSLTLDSVLDFLKAGLAAREAVKGIEIETRNSALQDGTDGCVIARVQAAGVSPTDSGASGEIHSHACRARTASASSRMRRRVARVGPSTSC